MSEFASEEQVEGNEEVATSVGPEQGIDDPGPAATADDNDDSWED